MKPSKTRLVVVFAGRFQPMHLGHLYVYDHLCDIFGKNNVWITTSDKQEKGSPLDFEQKRRVASQFFGIPKARVVKCKIPYVPTELLERFKHRDFSLVLALGEKDKDRLMNSNYFANLPKNIDNLQKVEDKTYVYTTKMFADGRNASAIRKQFHSNLSKKQKKDIFIKLFGSFDQDIFDTLIKSK